MSLTISLMIVIIGIETTHLLLLLLILIILISILAPLIIVIVMTRVAEVVRGHVGAPPKVWTQTKILSPNIRYFVAN